MASRLAALARGAISAVGAVAERAGLSYRPAPGTGKEGFYTAPPFASEARRRTMGTRDALTGVTTFYAGPTLTPFSTTLGGSLTAQNFRAAQSVCRNGGIMLQKADIDERLLQNDTHCKAVDHARRVAVTGKPFRVRPANPSELAGNVARFVAAIVDDVDSFDQACYNLLQANCSGAKTGETVWDPGRTIRFKLSKSGAQKSASTSSVTLEGWRVEGIEELHNKHLLYDVATNQPYVDMMGEHVPIRRPTRQPIDAWDYDQFKWIYHVTAGDGHDRLRGYAPSVVPLHIIKMQAIVRWATLLEIWGIQVPIGKIPNTLFENPEKRGLFERIIRDFGQGLGILTTDDFELMPSPAPGNLDSRGMHAALTGHCNQEISKVVQGETLTTEIGNVGSFKASETHENTKESVVAQDMLDLANTIRLRLFRSILLLNMPALQRLLGASAEEILAVTPRPHWVVSRAMTPEVQMTLIERGVKIGLRIDADYVYDTIGFVKAEDDGEAIRGELLPVAKGGAAVSEGSAEREVQVPDEGAAAQKAAAERPAGPPQKSLPAAKAEEE